MKDKRKPMEVIEIELTERALLEQLAEEAAELAQAALKLIRVRGNGNPTPVTVVDAEAALIEELSDVALVAAALGISKDSVLMDQKAARWAERIKKGGL